MNKSIEPYRVYKTITLYPYDLSSSSLEFDSVLHAATWLVRDHKSRSLNAAKVGISSVLNGRYTTYRGFRVTATYTNEYMKPILFRRGDQMIHSDAYNQYCGQLKRRNDTYSLQVPHKWTKLHVKYFLDECTEYDDGIARDVHVFDSIRDAADWYVYHRLTRSYYAAAAGISAVLCGRLWSYKGFVIHAELTDHYKHLQANKMGW